MCSNSILVEKKRKREGRGIRDEVGPKRRSDRLEQLQKNGRGHAASTTQHEKPGEDEGDDGGSSTDRGESGVLLFLYSETLDLQ